MKLSSVRALGLLALVTQLGTARVQAQLSTQFRLGVSPSATSLGIGESLSYTLNLSNLTGLNVVQVFVTNAFSAPVVVERAEFTLGQGTAYFGSIITNGNTVLFELASFSGLSGIAQMKLTVAPTATGFLTNAVTVAASQFGLPSAPATNVVVQVTNTTITADLGISITVPPRNVIAGDIMTYNVTVTNGGPGAVPGVMLTNMLPQQTRFVGVSPPRQVFTNNSGMTVVMLGTLANASASTLALTVQPSRAGLQTFSEAVGAANLLDPRLANNTARTNLSIANAVTGQLTASNASAMTYNPQTGLMNQTVRMSNVGTDVVASARLIVSGLTNWLYNAVGTNNGSPFVVYGSTLETNQFVDLVLEYFVPTRRPIAVANSNYTAVGVPAANLYAPSGTNSSFSITRAVRLSEGSVLLEFPAVAGSRYTIVYSDDAAFSHPLYAAPPLIAPADRVQWIDDGPPKTTNAPSAAISRFYRVMRN